MVGIKDLQGIGIIEDGLGFFKADSVLLLIDSCLAFVPLEFHVRAS